MNYVYEYEYEFVIVAVDSGVVVVADKNGGSYYLPKQISSEISAPRIGAIVHISAENPLELNDLAGTNGILCHGETHSFIQGNFFPNAEIMELLVCHTAYGSILLTNPKTKKDYVIFTSYLAEGYRTQGVNWNAVTEGNVVKFLFFGNAPVMPVPKHFSRRKNKKTPAVRSFPERYGAINGASIISPSAGTASVSVSG